LTWGATSKAKREKSCREQKSRATKKEKRKGHPVTQGEGYQEMTEGALPAKKRKLSKKTFGGKKRRKVKGKNLCGGGRKRGVRFSSPASAGSGGKKSFHAKKRGGGGHLKKEPDSENGGQTSVPEKKKFGGEERINWGKGNTHRGRINGAKKGTARGKKVRVPGNRQSGVWKKGEAAKGDHI